MNRILLACFALFLAAITGGSPAAGTKRADQLREELFVLNWMNAAAMKPELLTRAMAFLWSSSSPGAENPFSKILTDRDKWAEIQSTFRNIPSIGIAVPTPVRLRAISPSIDATQFARIAMEYAAGVNQYKSAEDFDGHFKTLLLSNRNLLEPIGRTMYWAYNNPDAQHLHSLYSVATQGETNIPEPTATARENAHSGKPSCVDI